MRIYQAITTKYLGPTNHRPGRITARCSAGSCTVEWEHGLNPDDNHARAAQALIAKLNWAGDWYGGGLPDGKGNVFVQTDLREGPAFVTHYREQAA